MKRELIESVKGVFEPFVYIVKDNHTGIKYIGSRTSYANHKAKLSDLGSRYFTSSKIVSNLWKNDVDRFDILECVLCDSNLHAIEMEDFLLQECDAVKSSDYYNMSRGGLYFNTSGKEFPESAKRKISEANKGNPGWIKGLTHSNETKKKISDIRTGTKRSLESRRKQSMSVKGEGNHFYGKKHTKENIKRMSDCKKGENHPNYGKKIQHPFRKCEYCCLTVSPTNLKRWHGDNCLLNPDHKQTLIGVCYPISRECMCPYCDVKGTLTKTRKSPSPNFLRNHFDKCKHKPAPQEDSAMAFGSF